MKNMEYVVYFFLILLLIFVFNSIIFGITLFIMFFKWIMVAGLIVLIIYLYKRYVK